MDSRVPQEQSEIEADLVTLLDRNRKSGGILITFDSEGMMTHAVSQEPAKAVLAEVRAAVIKLLDDLVRLPVERN